jgi:hypothetical protein
MAVAAGTLAPEFTDREPGLGPAGVWGLGAGGHLVFSLSEFLAERTGGDYYSAPGVALAAFLLCVLSMFWLVSVIVEGVVLMVLERDRPVRRVWLASLAANVGSYAAILVVLFVARVVDLTG